MTTSELRARATLIADNIECASQERWKSESHREDAVRNIEDGLRRLAAALGVTLTEDTR